MEDGEDDQSYETCNCSASCGGDRNRSELANAGMSPEPSVHPGRIEDQQAKGYAEEEVKPNQSEIVADPARLLESYEEGGKGGQNHRQGVGDEQVPVTK